MFFLLITIYALNSCKSEKDNAVVNLVFLLEKVSETDSTVILELSFKTKKRRISENGREIITNTNDMLVSVVPLNNISFNFVETVLRGSSITQVDAVDYPFGQLNTNSRGVIVPSRHTHDSVFMSFAIEIKKGNHYLFYSTFQKPCVTEELIEARYNLTVRQNENIAPKAVESEYAAIQQLMNTSFPTLNSFELNNPCFQITDSYSFYRDLPVKLLYYPL